MTIRELFLRKGYPPEGGPAASSPREGPLEAPPSPCLAAVGGVAGPSGPFQEPAGSIGLSFRLDDDDRCWFLFRGKIDVFAVPCRQGQLSGPRMHVARIEEGSFLFAVRHLAGAEPADGGADGICLLAVALPDAAVSWLPTGRFLELTQDDSLKQERTRGIDLWVGSLMQGWSQKLPPAQARAIEAEGRVQADAEESLRSQLGVWWLTVLSGEGDLDGLLPLSAGARTVLASRNWLRARSAVEVEVASTDTLLATGAWPDAMGALCSQLLAGWKLKRTQLEADDQHRVEQRKLLDQRRIESVERKLGDLLKASPPAARPRDESNPLWSACAAVAQVLDVKLTPPLASVDAASLLDRIRALTRSSRMQLREIALDESWWRKDGGPMVGLLREDLKPVALLQSSPSSYVCYDPENGTETPVDGKLAGRIAERAVMFYRALPGRPLRLIGLMWIAVPGMIRDLIVLLLAGCAGGLLGVLTPYLSGLLIDTVIPSSDTTQLLYLTAALLGANVGTICFDVTRSFATRRLLMKAILDIQPAIYERLLSLSPTFFRRFSAGDLSDRAMAMSRILQTVSSSIITSLLSALFSVFNLVLLFYYNLWLALIACLLCLLAVTGISIIVLLNYLFEKRLAALGGQLSGIEVQLIAGITKLRATCSEARALGQWGNSYSEQQAIIRSSLSVGRWMAAMQASLSTLCSLVLFYSVVTLEAAGYCSITVGGFYSFLSAFSALLASMVSVAASLQPVLKALLQYQRLTPILEAVPEVPLDRAEPGPLRGAIEVVGLTFSYQQAGPRVLDGVTFKVEPGQFVAIVGHSGCGKSTLLRMLLGFESPAEGSIFYDGMELPALDVAAVRRQFGVVTQAGKLLPGSIYENICGGSGASVKDAWNAAEIAGIADDIRAMPMGMQTYVVEGASTFSGGQKQRLMIARAVLHRPRILFMDEATSALDATVQAYVSGQLERLKATRLIIAHRLSTVVHADVIHVMHAGRIVQTGAYEELIRHEGVFRELVKRQTCA